MKRESPITLDYGNDNTPRLRMRYPLILLILLFLLLLYLVVTIVVFWVESTIKIASP